jgi:hypothetical protein
MTRKGLLAARTECCRLRIVTGGWLLWTRRWTFGFHKRRRDKLSVVWVAPEEWLLTLTAVVDIEIVFVRNYYAWTRKWDFIIVSQIPKCELYERSQLHEAYSWHFSFLHKGFMCGLVLFWYGTWNAAELFRNNTGCRTGTTNTLHRFATFKRPLMEWYIFK